MIRNAYFLDSITHITRERIPTRVVHSKGAGAFGYFVVTHDITKYCKANLFHGIGKRTQIAARFSDAIHEVGSGDLQHDPKGYSIKFYTNEGNWDMTGLNTPVYFYKDPQYFVGLVHSLKYNPVSNVRDSTAQWDFFINRPEVLHEVFWVMSNAALPDGYRHMPGFSIHAFELINNRSESHFARFRFTPDQGIKNFSPAEAMKINSRDPDYATRDLYNAIYHGNYPSWTMYIELMTLKEVEKADFDPFDVTALWPEDRYILLPVGKIILNRNPDNYFADVEQIAMNPGNVVPGILGAPDKLYEGRVLVYRDAQNYRLGINHNKISVNCPLRSRSYNRDGIPPVLDNGGKTPKYYPNNFNGPVPYQDYSTKKNPYIAKHKNYPNLNQTAHFYERLSAKEKDDFESVVTISLSRAAPSVRNRVLTFFAKYINAVLSYNLRKRLNSL